MTADNGQIGDEYTMDAAVISMLCLSFVRENSTHFMFREGNKSEQ